MDGSGEKMLRKSPRNDHRKECLLSEILKVAFVYICAEMIRLVL
jgi:hypothetical protein